MIVEEPTSRWSSGVVVLCTLRGRGHRENKFQIASCKLPDALIKPDESGVEVVGLPL